MSKYDAILLCLLAMVGCDVGETSTSVSQNGASNGTGSYNFEVQLETISDAGNKLADNINVGIVLSTQNPKGQIIGDRHEFMENTPKHNIQWYEPPVTLAEDQRLKVDVNVTSGTHAYSGSLSLTAQDLLKLPYENNLVNIPLKDGAQTIATADIRVWLACDQSNDALMLGEALEFSRPTFFDQGGYWRSTTWTLDFSMKYPNGEVKVEDWAAWQQSVSFTDAEDWRRYQGRWIHYLRFDEFEYGFAGVIGTRRYASGEEAEYAVGDVLEGVIRLDPRTAGQFTKNDYFVQGQLINDADIERFEVSVNRRCFLRDDALANISGGAGGTSGGGAGGTSGGGAGGTSGGGAGGTSGHWM